jgi:hypothetical protein
MNLDDAAGACPPSPLTSAHEAVPSKKRIRRSEEVEMSALTLVSHHLCPYVQRVAIALTEKTVPFERVTVDLSKPPEWFRQISPLGKVPLLRVSQSGGPEASLFEGSAICEFVEDMQIGPNLHPEDPLERARHRAWMEFGSTILSDIWRLEIVTDEIAYEAARSAIAAKFALLRAARGWPLFCRGPLQPSRCRLRTSLSLLRHFRRDRRHWRVRGDSQGTHVADDAGPTPERT